MIYDDIKMSELIFIQHFYGEVYHNDHTFVVWNNI